MEIIYYFDKKLGCCPFKKYLKESVLSERGRDRIVDNIIRVIDEYLVKNNGRPDPPRVEKYRGYNLFKIRIRKNSKTLIRIIYFIHNNKIILLNIFEKQDCKKYTKKEIKNVEKNILISDEYRKKYISNPNNYEKYN
jgi:hypothetical protein